MKETNCIIIGNGVSLLNYEAGKIIDSYEKVIRLNNFVINGYEKNVGTKTNVWIHSAYSNILLRDMSNIDNLLIINNKEEWDVDTFPKNKTTFVHFNCYPTLNSFNININETFYPSIGIQSILFYLTFFGSVTYIGFDSFTTGHYFDKNWKHWVGHNTNIESQLISELVKKNILFNLTDYL